MRHARMALAVGFCLGFSGCAQTRWQNPQPGFPARFHSTPQAWNSSALHSRPAGQVTARYYPAFSQPGALPGDPRFADAGSQNPYSSSPRPGAPWNRPQDSIALAHAQRAAALRQIAGTPPPAILAVALKAEVTPAADHAVAMARSDSPAPVHPNIPSQPLQSVDSLQIPPHDQTILPPDAETQTASAPQTTPSPELALSAPDAPAESPQPDLAPNSLTPPPQDVVAVADQAPSQPAPETPSNPARSSPVALALAGAAHDLARYAMAPTPPATHDNAARMAASQTLASDSTLLAPPDPRAGHAVSHTPAPGYAEVPGVPATSDAAQPTSLTLEHQPQMPRAPTAPSLAISSQAYANQHDADAHQHADADLAADPGTAGRQPAAGTQQHPHCPRCHHNHPPQTNPRNGLLARLGKLRFQDRGDLAPGDLPQAQFPRTYYDAVPRPVQPDQSTPRSPEPNANANANANPDAQPPASDRWAWLKFWERRKS